MSNMAQRVAVAAVGIPVVIWLIFTGGLALALLVVAAAWLGTAELFALAEARGVRPLRGLGILLAVLAPLLTWLVSGLGASSPFSVSLFGLELPSRFLRVPAWLFSQWPLALSLVPIAVLTGTLWRRSPAEQPLGAAAVTLLGPLYCGFLPASLLYIRYAADGKGPWPATWLVVFPLAVTWVCDSFAMWGGKLIGGAKLAPTVSPGKTRAGAVAGVVGGALVGLVYPALALGKGSGVASLPVWLSLGTALAVVAQVGDLAESLLKREAGVKDSSHLIPGHGGVLDRLDSLYFVVPVAAFLFRATGVL